MHGETKLTQRHLRRIPQLLSKVFAEQAQE